MPKELSFDVESLFGDPGKLYSPDAGKTWLVQYVGSQPIFLARYKTPATPDAINRLFEQAKDIVLLCIEANGKAMLERERDFPGEEWKKG